MANDEKGDYRRIRGDVAGEGMVFWGPAREFEDLKTLVEMDMLNVTVSGLSGLINQGRALHAAGKLREAELAYRQGVLAKQPNHPAR